MMNINYYIALVGKNPLPIYITGLKYINEDTKTYLIYTSDVKDVKDVMVSSKSVAENIIKSLKKKKRFNTKPLLLECLKSNYDDINKQLRKISTDIDNDTQVRSNNVNVFVDYTGATKMMAASVYRFFKEKCKQDGEKENISYKALYVSYDKNLIFETQFTERENIIPKTYANDLIAREYGVKCNDILALHGCQLDDDGYILNSSNVKSERVIDKLESEDFILYFEFRVNSKKVGDLVHEYFYIDHLCRKAGGDKSKIKLILNEESDIDSCDFYERIKNISTEDIEDRVELIREDECSE